MHRRRIIRKYGSVFIDINHINFQLLLIWSSAKPAAMNPISVYRGVIPGPEPLFPAEFSDSVGSVQNTLLLGVFLLGGCESPVDRVEVGVDVEWVAPEIGVLSDNKIISFVVCLSTCRGTASSLVM